MQLERSHAANHSLSTKNTRELIGIRDSKLMLLKMDRPSPYICRLTKCKPMFDPDSLETFAVDMGSLNSLVNQAKHIVKNTHQTIIRKESVGGIAENSLFGYSKVELLPCPRSPIKPNKRQWIH